MSPGRAYGVGLSTVTGYLMGTLYFSVTQGKSICTPEHTLL